MKELLKRVFLVGKDFGHAMAKGYPTYGLTFDDWYSKNQKESLSVVGSEFKKELRELLAKYNADIYAHMDGDTHGVSVEIVIDIDNKEVVRNHDGISQFDINK